MPFFRAYYSLIHLADETSFLGGASQTRTCDSAEVPAALAVLCQERSALASR